jgi:predicted HTH transcriptional regulator
LKSNRREVDVPIAAFSDGKYRVVLQHRAELLDLVDVTVQDGNPRPIQESGVTFDPPPLTDQVLALINGGEGPNVEFKLTIDRDLKGVDRAVAAFANTAGGTVLIGVGDDRSLHGIAPDRVAAMEDQLIGQLRRAIQPFPPIDVRDVEIQGEQIIAILVSSDGQPPFGVGNPPIYYIRRGANNYKATPDEVGELVRAHMPTSTNRLMDNLRRSQW